LGDDGATLPRPRTSAAEPAATASAAPTAPPASPEGTGAAGVPARATSPEGTGSSFRAAVPVERAPRRCAVPPVTRVVAPRRRIGVSSAGATGSAATSGPGTPRAGGGASLPGGGRIPGGCRSADAGGTAPGSGPRWNGGHPSAAFRERARPCLAGGADDRSPACPPGAPPDGRRRCGPSHRGRRPSPAPEGRDRSPRHRPVPLREPGVGT